MKLSANEATVIEAWRGEDPGYGLYFSTITKRSGIKRSLTRRTVRALARKNMVTLDRLFDDDGRVAGSGYSITPTGIQYLEPKP